MLHIFILGKIPGYNNIWFIGNSFMVRSFRQYFQDKDHTLYGGYVKDHFTTSGYMSDKYMSHNQNLIGRIQNCLAKAIQEEVILPKMIVFVLDEDVLQYLNHPGPGITKAMEHLIGAIMTDCDRLIASQKEYLPKRAKKAEYPQMIWILSPLHDNFSNITECIKFNKAVESVAQFHDNTFPLQLKKIWNKTDNSLYSAEYHRFTNKGYGVYWMAIDATLKFADTILLKIKKPGRKNGGNSTDNKFQRRDQDQYHWSRAADDHDDTSRPQKKKPRHDDDCSRYGKLLTPPPKRRY